MIFNIDDLDVANMFLLSLYLGIMTSILPPLLLETNTLISSTRLELAGTLQVLVLVFVLNFYALISSLTLTNSSNTWLDILGLQWYWLSSSLDLTVSSALSPGQVWAIHLCCTLLCLSSHLSVTGTATDVIHSIAWPHLLLRFDVCPGRISSMSCASNLTGMVAGQCSELCGSLHGFMSISVFRLVSYYAQVREL
jgi:cytochrome c oxidase subunit II